MNGRVLIVAGICAVLATACTGPDPTNTAAAVPLAAATSVAATTPEPTATPQPSATPEPTATPEPEPTATPAPTATPEPDPAAAVLAFQATRNDLVTAGDPDDYYTFMAEHAWPPGEWTPELMACMFDALGETIDDQVHVFYDTAAMVETPEWRRPKTTFPGSERIAGPGTYALPMAVSGITVGQRHLYIADGVAHFFPGADIEHDC